MLPAHTTMFVCLLLLVVQQALWSSCCLLHLHQDSVISGHQWVRGVLATHVFMTKQGVVFMNGSHYQDVKLRKHISQPATTLPCISHVPVHSVVLGTLIISAYLFGKDATKYVITPIDTLLSVSSFNTRSCLFDMFDDTLP